MKPISWLLGFVMLVLLVGIGLVWSGAYNVAADSPHWQLTQWLMETARDRSIAVQASDVVVPTLDEESFIREGAATTTQCALAAI
jgi:hypothetical protein